MRSAAVAAAHRCLSAFQKRTTSCADDSELVDTSEAETEALGFCQSNFTNAVATT